MNQNEILIIGSNGQLGKELVKKYPEARTLDRDKLDISNYSQVLELDLSGVKTIINAAAYTDVNGAETAEGRVIAWAVNAKGAANLTKLALQSNLTLVHISTDYVFDGSQTEHSEDEPLSPLGIYGQTKAAADVAVSIAPKHYIIRTSWLIGEGKNFVRTMVELGKKGIDPDVVADQFGRPTFTDELVRAIDHLINVRANFGTYNVSNSGTPVNWADLTRAVFNYCGLTNSVNNVTSSVYFANKPNVSPRPKNSIFDLSKLKATGFKSRDWQTNLKAYIKENSL